MGIVTTLVVGIVIGLGCGSRSGDGGPRVLDVRLGAEERVALPIPVGGFMRSSPSLVSLLGALREARESRSIRGVLLRVGGMTFSRAEVQEIAAEVEALRRAGKKTIAFADAYSTDEYVLAAACDRIVGAPGGTVELVGLRAEVYFYKELFDKLGVEADLIRIGEYKSAVEPFTRTSLSPEAKRMFEGLLDNLYSQWVDVLAKGRRRRVEEVRAWFDGGPFTAEEARRAGLLDELLYPDELEAYLERFLEEEVNLVPALESSSRRSYEGLGGLFRLWRELSSRGRRVRSRRDKLALVRVEGMIVPGKVSSPWGEGYASSGAVTKALEEAASDSTVKAIVLRVDSPGGSALASDLIWRAVRQASAKKPVVVSMGSVAASGGYYVASAGDYLLAEPATLTGSIGVFGGKLSLRGFYSRIGVRKEVISRGRNASLDDESRKYSESERARMTVLVDSTYRRFVRLVAEGRKMSPEAVEAVAKGQVWTGAQAVRNGLVDELGGFRRAFEVAKEKAGYSKETPFELLEVPEPPSFLDLFAGDAGSFHLSEVLEPMTRERVFALWPYRLVFR